MVLRIVIVEDIALVRDSIRYLCVRKFRHQVVGEAGDGIEAVKVIRDAQPDVVLLDLQLPGDSGFGVAQKVRQEMPGVRILLMSVHCSGVVLKRIEEAQCSGFIDKNFGDGAMLGQALQEVAAGRRFFSPSFLEAAERRRHDPHAFDKLLSKREWEVLAMIGCMLEDWEIAARLGLAADTVEKHRFNIMRKLDLEHLREVIKYSIDHGFPAFIDGSSSSVKTWNKSSHKS